MGTSIIDVSNIPDPVLKAIIRYENHPSILKIAESIRDQSHFSFKYTTYVDVYNEINNLNNSTAYPKNNIPPNIIKENYDIFTLKLLNDFNHAITYSIYPDNFKNADITPAHKGSDNTDKSNYRPVSILPSISKIYERLLYSQINAYMDDKLAIYQCGFRKTFSVQNCLILMVEKWKRSIDEKGYAGALLSDLSKAFDCLDHELMLAKLHAYGFDYNALKLVYCYLTNRYQRVKVNSNYSSWKEIINGVPQGSILGPLLFNIYLSDLFLFIKETNVANYADDNTLYVCEKDMDLVINKLEHDCEDLITWVSNNTLKANPNKFHLLLSETDTNLSVKVDSCEIYNSNNQKFLGIKIDNKLTFNEHVSGLCKKASQKLHALARVAQYMTVEKRRIIMNTFINSQFGYCPLIWMFHSRELNNRINKIQERALRIVYNDKLSNFDELLRKEGCMTIHERNIQMLGTEIYKTLNGYAPKIMEEVFQIKENLRYCTRFPFKSRNVRTVAYGTETLSFIGPKIWSLIPDDIKLSASLSEFKRKIKLWKPVNCPCRLCKSFVKGVGFVQVTK